MIFNHNAVDFVADRFANLRPVRNIVENAGERRKISGFVEGRETEFSQVVSPFGLPRGDGNVGRIVQDLVNQDFQRARGD